MKTTSPLDIDISLIHRLQQAEAEIEILDEDTVIFHNMPAKEPFFNKERTNVLFKRPRSNMPYIILVDEDLEYTGDDAAVLRVFTGSRRRDNWQALNLIGGSRDFGQAAGRAFAILGFDDENPRLEQKVSGKILSVFAEDLSLQADEKCSVPLQTRMAVVVSEVVSCLLRWGQKRLPVVCGESGVGKTHVMKEVARRLKSNVPSLRLFSVEVSRLFSGTLFHSEREEILEKILEETTADEDMALVLEEMDLAIRDTHYGRQMLAGFFDRGARLLGTTYPSQAPQLMAWPALERRIQVISLAEASQAETISILADLREPLKSHHGIDIDESCLASCVRAAIPLPGHFPAKAIDLLDSAAARAALAGAGVIGMDDLFHGVDIVKRALVL